MSAGAFSNIKYESNDGSVHPVTIQPETASLVIDGTTNLAPTAPIDSKIKASVSGSPRSNGLITRRVTVAFGDTDGAAPDGYKRGGRIPLPWLVKSTFDALKVGQTGTYLGKVVTVTGKRGERPE